MPGAETQTVAPAAWLHFTSGSMAGQSIPLQPDVTSIGRADDNDLVIEDETVSRLHARISNVDGQYFIEDEGSVSGTMVEGGQATRTLLTSGATLALGDTEAMFMQGGLAPEPAPGTSQGTQSPAETIFMEQAEGMMAWLAVTAGPKKGTTYQLKVGENTIGRGTDNDMVIEDASVTRRHAMVRARDNEFLLVDLGSRSGTKVAGKTLEGKELRSGGVVTVGRTTLSLVDVQAGQAAPEAVSSASETIMHQPGSDGGGILIAQSGPDSGKSFPLSEGDNLIGREPDCQVLLSDERVSRTHTLIRREGDRFVVFDLGSRSGTQVDGEAIGGYQLSVGETFSLGSTDLVLMQVGTREG